MKSVLTTRTAEPYRDPTPGIQARLAELRAAWTARAPVALDERAAVIRAQAERIAMTRAVALGQLLVTAAALTLWIHQLAQADPEVMAKCGTPNVLAAPFVLLLVVLPIWLLARYGRWMGGRTAVSQAARMVTDVTGGGIGVELERLANETPDVRLDAHVQRLRRQNRVWSQVASGLALVLLPLLLAALDADTSEMADAAFVAEFPLGMLALGLLLAIEPRLVSTWWAALPLAAAMALLVVSSLFGAAALVLVVVQGSIVVQRLTVR
jgi:uncharacterized integral membrane protein